MSPSQQDGHDYFRLGRISRQVEELLANGEIERSIIIGIPYKNVQERRLTYHPEGSKFEAYKRFLANELVPFADSEYPTYQVGSGTDADRRLARRNGFPHDGA
jgi:enterochelin esterase family protein